jgi:hypothetical protein
MWIIYLYTFKLNKKKKNNKKDKRERERKNARSKETNTYNTIITKLLKIALNNNVSKILKLITSMCIYKTKNLN